ncbi:hypothetical protein SHKM778_34280 [Streptomyces sp. KM77-8]|uniref:Uncharacterized protein n=1 Tax=Streptomyces haneummycinicus TaxID=3074435 RepID=A0AAT9HI52_9ACTN
MGGFPDLIKDVFAGGSRQEEFQEPDRIPRLVTGTITRCPWSAASWYSRWVRITFS